MGYIGGEAVKRGGLKIQAVWYLFCLAVFSQDDGEGDQHSANEHSPAEGFQAKKKRKQGAESAFSRKHAPISSAPTQKRMAMIQAVGISDRIAYSVAMNPLPQIIVTINSIKMP